MKIAGKESKEI
ncbi:tonB-system energizer ExbB, partial [Yersinia pestis PY-12]